MYAPLSVGLISRTPYLTFPRVFLSHIYHVLASSDMSESDQSALLSRSLGQMIHGVAVPVGSSSLSLWNLPRLGEGASNELQLYMADCGLEGAPMEEARPVPSAFNRGFSEVDLVAIFDLLSLETILFTISSLLLEQKVLLVSARYSSSFIAHLCESLRVLMYPFDWQHVFIPLIPAVAKEALIDPETHSPTIPLWIDSALTSDHIHPLRFLEAPAPLFGGLRIRGSGTVAMQPILRQLFPDLNIIDIDNDAIFAAPQRVDRIAQPLPGFPRKLAQTISARLGPLADLLCVGGRLPSGGGVAAAKERLERYLHWDEVFPKELFTGRKSAPVVEELKPTSSSAESSMVDTFRRRSLVRTSGIMSGWNPMTDAPSRTRTWLGRSFFGRAGGPSGAASHRRPSLSGASTPPEQPENIWTDPVEALAPQLIQGAMVESFTRMFFAYKDFLSVEGMTNLGRSNSVTSHSSLFIGSDRHFASDSFSRCFERTTQLGNDAVGFLRSFLTTQSWDLFIRTTALQPVSHVFDAACAFYSITNKVEYLKYKQSAVVVAAESIPLTPQWVLEEVEVRMRPCPLNKKPKDHFFDELLALIARRHHIDLVVFSQASDDWAPPHGDGISPTADDAPRTATDDALALLSGILVDELGRKFSDGNTESAKLISLFQIGHKRPSLQEVLNVRDSLPLIVSEGKMECHLVHEVLVALRQPLTRTISPGTTSNQRHSPRSMAGSLLRPASMSESGGGFDESASLWSGKSRPMMKNLGTGALMDDSKLLGGIPRSTLATRSPQAPPFLLRKWTDQHHRSLGTYFRIVDATRVDYHCTNCGSFKSLIEVLREGRYADFITSTEIEFITTLCGSCEALVCPEIVPSEPLMAATNGGHVRILKLPVLLSKLRGAVFPLTVELYLNLSLLLGIHVELYTGYLLEGVEKRQLRGVVSFSDILSDFLSCTAVVEASEAGGGLSPTAMAVVPTPLRSGAESEALSPRSEESSPVARESSGSEEEMPESPSARALWRVRQYRRLLREKEKRKQDAAESTTNYSTYNILNANLTPPVVRVHVDSPPIVNNRTVFMPTTRSARRHIVADSNTPSPPAPPSERRPDDAAPRRARKSGSGPGTNSAASSPYPSTLFSR